MSHIHKLTLNWKRESRVTEPRSLILKVPGFVNTMAHKENETVNSPVENANEWLEMSHSREILFYEIFSHCTPPLKLPRFYYGFEFRMKHENGLIIMEDLTPTSRTIKMLPGANETQVVSMIGEIARVHTASWALKDWVKKLPNFVEAEGFLREMRTLTGVLRTLNPEKFGRLVDELLPQYTMENFTKTTYEDEKHGFPANAVHGDLWMSNVLWKMDSVGEATNEISAIIDWQMIHAGNPCEDLARFLALNTSGEFRRANTDRLLKLYAERVAELSPARKAPFTLEQLRTAYIDALLPVAMFLGFGAPMYYDMDSVVGTENDSERKAKQAELLQRVQMFFEDTLTHHHANKNDVK